MTKEIIKAEETTATALTTLTSGDIPDMLELVTKQIAVIQRDMPNSPKVTASLTGFGKISEIDTVDGLIKAASLIIAKESAYKKAAKEILGEVKSPIFKLHDVTSKDWLNEIKGRVLVVANKEKLTKLKKVQKKLEANLSAKDKLAKDLKDIQYILSTNE